MRLTLIRKTNRGFTMNELMICISIIGILAGIAIPSYIKYRERGFCCPGHRGLEKAATGGSGSGARQRPLAL